MNYLNETDALALYSKAEYASKQSYSPYSDFPVGAALLSKKGHTYTGTNIENIAYTGTHAEIIAIGLSRMAKDYELAAIAVYAPNDNVSPCGNCRQALWELGPNIIVIFKYGGKIIQQLVSELLPYTPVLEFKEK